ncbi:MAG: patatin-like phospholipase family protein [Pseudomonadota bacterium]
MLREFADHSPGLPLLYPGVSRRYLVDLADRVRTAAEANRDEVAETHPHEYIREVIATQDTLARAASPAFRRSVLRERVIEYIAIVKAPEVETSIERLAELLAEGLNDATGFDVKAGLDQDITPGRSRGKNRIRLIYTEAGDLAFEKHAGKFTRIVYVTLSGLRIPQDPLHDALPDDLLVEREGNVEAHFCSIIPTIITPTPDQRVIELRTEPLEAHHVHHRLHRDATILSAQPDDYRRLPEHPERLQIERWARNVANRQIGFTTSGGGASSYRTIAILDALHGANMDVDIFGGLSGGAVIGAFMAGAGRQGLERVVEMGPSIACILPQLMLSTKPMEAIVDKALGYQRVGETSMRFFAVTTHLRKGIPPQGEIVTRATLGQATRVSGSLPVGFAPTVIGGRRYADGMASAIVPTLVAIHHGADVTFACNCVPGPNRTNPFGGHWLGRELYRLTPFDRAMDYWTWLFFLTTNASTAYGQGSDVYFAFDPENIATLESLHWGKSFEILAKARSEDDRIDEAVAMFKEKWEALA